MTRLIDWGLARLLVLFVAMGVSLSLWAPARSQDPVAPLSDRQIHEAVETRLLRADGVPSHLINVDVRHGIVTLSGSSDSLLARDRAGDVARGTSGVNSVINRIAVAAPERSDQALRQAIMRRLRSHPALEAKGIDVQVDQGEATLNGQLRTWAARRQAGRLAKSVKGVQALHNRVTVDTPQSMPDEAIQRQVRAALVADELVDDGLVEVAVDDGKVTLSGAVGSAMERSRSHRIAHVPGARSVDISELQIRWRARDTLIRSQDDLRWSDSDMRRAIADALPYQPGLESDQISVEVNNGVALLQGVADSLPAKEAAGAVADTTYGVTRVRNLIKVRPAVQWDDQRIAGAAKEAMSEDPYLDGLPFHVQVEDARIYLEGTVYTAFEKQHAEEVAAQVPGVTEVVNRLDFDRQWEPIADWELKRNVRDQLQWSAVLDADDIQVRVQDGVVTLDGIVDTIRQHNVAERDAYEAGAKHVRNHLKVEQAPWFSLGATGP